MLACKAARGCRSLLTDTDPSPEQIKHNLDVMRKAADEFVVGEKRLTVGGQKKKRMKRKEKLHGKKRRIHRY